MQDAPKAVWSIPYVSVAFFPSLKQNFIAYRSSKVSSRPDCIFEIHQLWQSGFSRVYPNSSCSCSFEPEIIKIGQSSHKMYSNNIVNFQESTTVLNACTKKSGNLSYAIKSSQTKSYIFSIYVKKIWFGFIAHQSLKVIDVKSIFIQKTVLFQTIQFRISTQFSSIWPIDRTLSVAIIPSQSGPGSDGNVGVLCIP